LKVLYASSFPNLKFGYYIFWKGLMKVKRDSFSRGKFEVGSGEGVRFWEDRWLGD
jgi:hypothetical protein